MKEENIIVIPENPKHKELIEGEIPTVKAQLETNYKMLRELHKAQIRATERLMQIAEDRLATIHKLEKLLENTEKALAIKNTVMEQMVASHTNERQGFADEIQGLKRKKR